MVGRLWRWLSNKLHDGGVPEPDVTLGTAHPAYQAALQKLLDQVGAAAIKRVCERQSEKSERGYARSPSLGAIH